MTALRLFVLSAFVAAASAASLDFACMPCIYESVGPCQHPDGTCHDFHFGLGTVCPPGTKLCHAPLPTPSASETVNNPCVPCEGGTSGPCLHANDHTCTGYGASGTCVAGQIDCGVTPTPSSSSSVAPPFQCQPCKWESSGPCQHEDGTCHAFHFGSTCPPGTYVCWADASQSASPATNDDGSNSGSGNGSGDGSSNSGSGSGNNGGSATPAIVCGECVLSSTGPCQTSHNSCFDYMEGSTTCPPGTYDCSWWTPTASSSSTPTIPPSATRTPAVSNSNSPTSPASESPTSPASESPTSPASESPTSPASESPTSPASESPTSPASESPTSPASESPTSPASESPTGAAPAVQSFSPAASPAPCGTCNAGTSGDCIDSNGDCRAKDAITGACALGENDCTNINFQGVDNTTIVFSETCMSKDHPWQYDDAGISDWGAPAAWTISAIVGASVAQCGVVAGVRTIKKMRNYEPRAGPIKLPLLKSLPVVAWVLLDSLFRVAPLSVPGVNWSQWGMGGVASFFEGFLLDVSNSLVLAAITVAITFASFFMCCFGHEWARPRDDGLPLKGADTTDSLGTIAYGQKSGMQRMAEAMNQATAFFLFSPAAYILLNPWVCGYSDDSASSEGYYVTKDCGNPYMCWSPIHTVFTAVALIALGVMFFPLALAKGQRTGSFGISCMALQGHTPLPMHRETNPMWGLPHCLATTLGIRLIMAWSAKVLRHVNICASTMVGMTGNSALIVAFCLALSGFSVLPHFGLLAVVLPIMFTALLWSAGAVASVSLTNTDACMPPFIMLSWTFLCVLASCVAMAYLLLRMHAGGPSDEELARDKAALAGDAADETEEDDDDELGGIGAGSPADGMGAGELTWHGESDDEDGDDLSSEEDLSSEDEEELDLGDDIDYAHGETSRVVERMGLFESASGASSARGSEASVDLTDVINSMEQSGERVRDRHLKVNKSGSAASPDVEHDEADPYEGRLDLSEAITHGVAAGHHMNDRHFKSTTTHEIVETRVVTSSYKTSEVRTSAVTTSTLGRGRTPDRPHTISRLSSSSSVGSAARLLPSPTSPPGPAAGRSDSRLASPATTDSPSSTTLMLPGSLW